MVRSMTSVACLYGVSNIKSHHLHGFGRRFYTTSSHISRVSQQLQRNKVLNTILDFCQKLPEPVQFCVLVTVLFGAFQLVPVTNRPHLAISSDKLENMIGTYIFENQARENAKDILSPLSPESIRVESILRQILQATHSALGLKNDCKVSVYIPRKDLITKGDSCFYTIGFNTRVLLRELFFSDTKKVRVKPQRVRKFGVKYGTKHLDGLNWKLMVLDSSIENAAYCPNGKIIFYTGWFKEPGFTDADIATILAHEVGHGLGRHGSEKLMRAIWLSNLVLVPLSNFLNYQIIALIIGVIKAFFSRRRELEADYIGMMLMASAGYDPCHAPRFLKKHGNIEEGGLAATHPSGKERADKLNEISVMSKAVEIYRQIQSGNQIKTFI